MSLTQVRAPRLRRPGESEIEAMIIRLAGLKNFQGTTQGSGRKVSREDVCKAITAGIESGALTPGDKLPSIRRLGERLGVPHGVVRRAFEHLLSRGWLEMIHGSGTYVSRRSTLLVGTKPDEVSSSVLRIVAEELMALYSTNSLIENTDKREIVHAHPRLRHRP